MLGKLFGRGIVESVGDTVVDVVEVFKPNATEVAKMDHDMRRASLEQFSTEFAQEPGGRFDTFVNGLNRLPRPVLGLGTIGLFAYAMIDPEGFARRMEGLAVVPEPLWWLLGAVVSFYFGARELHYQRVRRGQRASPKR